jgi:hypothetical protein
VRMEEKNRSFNKNRVKNQLQAIDSTEQLRLGIAWL